MAPGLAARVNLIGPWLRRVYGGPVAKLGLDPGIPCPHRAAEGGGCRYCPPGGAGRGGEPRAIALQLREGLIRLARRAERAGRPLPAILAYFQAHTATNTTPARLAGLLDQALVHPRVAGLIVATRPDCLDAPRLAVLSAAARRRPLWLELGLQSAHDPTLAAMGRGHDAACFARAVAACRAAGLRVVAHVILGLPGEGPAETEATARFLAGLGVWGVKLHNLLILEGSGLARDWRDGRLAPLARAVWAGLAARFLAHLPPAVTIHRLVADPGPDRLLAPAWAADKNAALAALAAELAARGLKQGDLCHG